MFIFLYWWELLKFFCDIKKDKDLQSAPFFMYLILVMAGWALFIVQGWSLKTLILTFCLKEEKS